MKNVKDGPTLYMGDMVAINFTMKASAINIVTVQPLIV